MKAVMLMFDSLNRHLLQPYGCDWTFTPNFQRLARKTVKFNTAYVGSMPCMPARRELHTARPNFLHAPWGCLEPFDDSAIEMLNHAGVQTHLTSDHYHYWEENACTYHTKYNTWRFFRGQEGDPFIGQVDAPYVPPNENRKGRPQDWLNRMHIQRERDWSLVQTIDEGIEHIRRNAQADRWFCQIECFDPHEPWFVPERYKDLYPGLREAIGESALFDWPGYEPVDPQRDPPEKIERARKLNAALISMCDAYLGDVLDVFDELNLWEDTMLIVNTDHGFLLGEHDWWAKNAPPWYEELSHVPLFIHDPRCPEAAGSERDSFVQTIDLPTTLLGLFDVEPTERMLGADLAATIRDDTPARGAGLFGGFNHYVSVTDGRYVYMRAPTTDDGGPICQYTMLPVQLRRMWRDPARRPPVELVDPLPFTQGMPVLKVTHGGGGRGPREWGHLLFDLHEDPKQERPLDDEALEQRMIALLTDEMQRCDAPSEQYERLGLA